MVAPASSTAPSRDLLDAATRGDGRAFGRLVEPHRSELHAHCYRMLGSLHDAEDALQDALLRAWRGLSRFEHGRPLRPWLYTIATNVCLDAISRRPRRVLPMDLGPPSHPNADIGKPLAASVWVEPYPDERFGVQDGYAGPEARYEQREAVELAFVAALQHLPGRQRAALILREVLGFSAREVADSFDTTVASVNSALQRARSTIAERLPDQSQQTTLRSLGDERVRDLVTGLINAFERGDVATVLAMLTDDATFAMPPYAGWQHGRRTIGHSWLMPSEPDARLRYLSTRANGQLALAAYLWHPESERYQSIALDVLTLHGSQITAITAFRSPETIRSFGLANQLAS